MFDLLASILEAFIMLTGYVSGNSTFPKPLSSEEEKKYIACLEDGHEDAKHILIEHNLRLVAHIAKKYSDEKNLEDLISIGTIGLIKGINTFNSRKSIRLSSYISRCIENEILMHLRSTKRLANEISIEESIGTDKEGNNMTLSDILTTDDVDISNVIGLKIETKQLYKAMKKVLSDNEIRIMTSRYGLGNTKKKTQKEIARELGISRSYVSRIEKRCLKRLYDEMKKSDIFE